VQTAAKRVKDGEDLRQAHCGLAALQFNQEADPDAGRCSQLVLTQALGKPSLTDDGTYVFDSHLMSRSGIFSGNGDQKSSAIPDRECEMVL
jgi:hypothetical protein